jgi:acyl carrier protein
MTTVDNVARGDRETVVDAVRTAFAEALEVPAERIDAEAALADLPGMESVRFLRAVAALEDRLSTVIPDDVLYDMQTLGDLVAWLARRTAVSR